jgi:hypothetical protein
MYADSSDPGCGNEYTPKRPTDEETDRVSECGQLVRLLLPVTASVDRDARLRPHVDDTAVAEPQRGPVVLADDEHVELLIARVVHDARGRERSDRSVDLFLRERVGVARTNATRSVLRPGSARLRDGAVLRAELPVTVGVVQRIERASEVVAQPHRVAELVREHARRVLTTCPREELVLVLLHCRRVFRIDVAEELLRLLRKAEEVIGFRSLTTARMSTRAVDARTMLEGAPYHRSVLPER